MSSPNLVAMFAVLVSATSSAAESDLEQLFPKEADVFIAASGLTRLELPPEILKDCKADLSDLRIFDLQGREVPFVLDRKPPAATTMIKVVEVKPLAAHQSKREPDKGEPAMRSETYSLPVPDVLLAGEAWDLVLDVRPSHFVRRIQITDPKQSILLREESIFRLPEMRASRTRILLPQLTPNVNDVLISGEEDFFLEPTFRFERSRRMTGDQPISVPLVELSRSRENGKTVLELQRPSGIVPQSLMFQTTTHVFNRSVDIYDWGSGADKPGGLGNGTLLRVIGTVPIENLEVPINPARGDRLRIEIADGDSPELSSLQVSAILSSPILVFDLASNGEGGRSAVLRFGGGRARAPRYDVAALASHGPASGTRARVAAELYNRNLSIATLGAVRDSPLYQARPVLAFAMRPGAEVDPRLYSHQREINVSDSPDGLSRLTLQAQDLALLRRDFADVRIVDAQRRQWPYLLKPRATMTWIEVTRSSQETKDHSSRIRMELPSNPFLVDMIELQVANPYFDRAFKLRVTDLSKHEYILAASRLTRSADEPASASVTIPVPETWATGLELQVDNGNDAPLELLRVRLRQPQPDIFLIAPAGEYSMLLGNADDFAPRYEIDRVRSLILSVSTGTATVGPLGANPRFQRSARLASAGSMERLALWTILGTAVLVLSAITLRMAQREKAPPDTQPPPDAKV